MPHRLPKLLFLGLLVFVTRTDASPVLIGRDEWAGDSLWDLDMEDVFDAVSRGLGALPMVWDLLTAPGTTTTPSEVPSKQTDERFPLFEPTAMKTCAAEGESQGRQVDVLAVEHSWWQAEQEPETGRPIITTCDLPNDSNNDAYVVREIRFDVGGLKHRWPTAILVSDPVNNVYFRYNVMIGKVITSKYQKIPNAIFMRQGKVVKRVMLDDAGGWSAPDSRRRWR